MTAPKIIETILPASLFGDPPRPGQHYHSPTGKTVLSVSRVRRDVAGRYRLFSMRVRLRDLDPSVEILPWPRPSKTAAATPDGLCPAPEHTAIVPSIKRAKAARDHVKTLLADDRANYLVPSAQVASGKSVYATWRDPDDTNPNRRVAKEVHGFRTSSDWVAKLQDAGTISRHQARAAIRLRANYEAGELGLRGSTDWSAIPTGYGPSDGPSEIRLAHLERFQNAMAHLGRQGDVVLAVCVKGQGVADYATRWRMNRYTVIGRLLGALDCLRDYYVRIDEPRRKEIEGQQQASITSD